MLYRPHEAKSLLWDTWIFYHAGVYHLYHLVRDDGKAWDRLGHATSTNLLYWEPQPDIPIQSSGQWDGGPTLTGMVIPFAGRFAMTYGSVVEGVERIGVMFSEDLYTWEKCPGNPVLLPGAPYEDDPAGMALPSVAWRDAFVQWLPDQAIYEALVCARVREGETMQRGAVARARSKDLTHWKRISPLAAPMAWQDMEVPERFQLGERHYLIFSTSSTKGADLFTPHRSRSSGTFYMVSNDRDGGYAIPADPLLLGTGEGTWDCYVGRYLNAQGTPLIYHHHCGPRPALACPKQIRAAADGTLSLAYWPGLDALKGALIPLDLVANTPIKTGAVAHGSWEPAGSGLVGRCGHGPTSTLLDARGGNLHFHCTVDIGSAQRAGVILRYQAESDTGVGIAMDRHAGGLVIGRLQRLHSGVVKIHPRDVYRMPISAGSRLALRILAGEEFFDVYVDDRLIFSSVLATEPRFGRIGLLVDTGEATFGSIEAWELSLGTAGGIADGMGRRAG